MPFNTRCTTRVFHDVAPEHSGWQRERDLSRSLIVRTILPLSLLSFTRSHSVLVARVYTKNIRSGRTWSPRGTRYQSASRNTASRWRVPRAQLLFTHKPVWSGSLAVVAAVEGEDERVHDWLPRRRDWSSRDDGRCSTNERLGVTGYFRVSGVTAT